MDKAVLIKSNYHIGVHQKEVNNISNITVAEKNY